MDNLITGLTAIIATACILSPIAYLVCNYLGSDRSFIWWFMLVFMSAFFGIVTSEIRKFFKRK